MSNRSLLLMGLATALAGACAAQATSTQSPVQNEVSRTAEGAGLPLGDYACVIDDYTAFLCRVETDADGKKQLAKHGGSQRIRGAVYDRADGFDFAGTFFCPWGACDAPVRARFHKLGTSVYASKFAVTHGEVSFRLQYLDGKPFGAAMYGGDGYSGGFGAGGYGGLVYGLNYGY